MDGTTPVGVDENVDPAHKHPKGALCAAGGCYPPLQSAPLDETVGADRIRPQPRFFDSTRLSGATSDIVPFIGRLNSRTFGRILSAPTTMAALPVQCLLTLRKKFYADFLLLSSAFFAIIKKILGKYTLAAFGECCGGYL